MGNRTINHTGCSAFRGQTRNFYYYYCRCPKPVQISGLGDMNPALSRRDIADCWLRNEYLAWRIISQLEQVVTQWNATLFQLFYGWTIYISNSDEIRTPSGVCQRDISISVFIHSVFCLMTGPKPPPKRFLHIVRSRASSFKWEYTLLHRSSRSSSL